VDSSSTVEVGPATASGGEEALDAVAEDFENLYDVPFIMVNRIEGKIEAEVEASDDEAITLARIHEAQEVVRRKHGQHLFASKVGDREYPELQGIYHGVITLHFTPDTDGGL
jgi:hypothetical protein